MKYCFVTFFAIWLSTAATAQTVEETYPKTLFCENDLFALKYGDFPRLDTFKVSRKDKSSPGFDASIGAYAVIYYNNDSLRLNYNNKIPYQHNYYINFESPKGKTTLRFHFNEVANYFDKQFMALNNGKIGYAIPEVYELANIIWTLSPNGQKATDLNKKGSYYQKVVNYFKPYLSHPIFKALNFPDSLYASKYYDFRENSFAFNFKEPNVSSANTTLLFNGPYYYVYGDELADSSLFGKLKPLVEDFAKKTRFRQFYKSNMDFYKKEIEREKQLLPVQQMWHWLEEEFPKTKYQSYSVVFSPLIGGSHSTQNYATYNDTAFFSQCVMFICNTNRVDEDKALSEKQREGLMSGVVFTEIDHNYVNRASNKYRKTIDSIFSKRNVWTKPGSGSDFYDNGISVFNEYMTWSVFCLYILDNYNTADADFIINEREARMEDKRNFIKFKAFNQALIKIRQEHKAVKTIELYPYILDWCRQQV